MNKQDIVIINILLLFLITFIHISEVKQIHGSQSKANTTFISITGPDIKNALSSIQNDTIPHYVKLSDSQIKESLSELPGWAVVNGKLHKTFTFVDFSTLFAFMYQVADSSQKLNHHPNMTSTWNKLNIDYDTWSLGHVISDFDVKAASNVEKLYQEGNYQDSGK